MAKNAKPALTKEQLRDKFFQEIGEGLKAIEKREQRTPLQYLDVDFKIDGKKIVTLGLATAIDSLANDIYIFEDGNLFDCDSCEVRSI